MKKVWIICVILFSAGFISAQCIKGNCSNGKGIFSFQDGSQYTGNFKNSKFSGFGIMKYGNGNVYEGSWKNDLRWGKGILIYSSGDTYTGTFKEDKFWGKGKYQYTDGDSYEGEWVNQKAHGKGIYRFGDNERYEGSFFKGEFSGVGAFYYTDGTIYIGNWKNSKKHGEGKMHYKNGEKIHGTWANDELVDRAAAGQKVKADQPSREETSETVMNTQRHWKDCTNIYCSNELGMLIYQDGSVWKGEFLNGSPHGTGTLDYASGNKYEGEIENHAPNGDGIMYFANGQTIGGNWVDGYPVKQDRKYKKKKKEKLADVAVNKSDEVKIWAVIVGVSAYSHMPSLKYTDDDAYQIYAFLKSPEGGALPNEQIRLLIDENATRQNILAGMNDVLLRADENDVVLMYYSGHGLPGMFLPIDFDGYRNNLSHNEVMDVFNASKAKHKLCIADACHSGSLLASRSPFTQQLDGFYGEYDKTKGGTALIMSSKSEEVSLETSGLRQGIFSHYLIRGLNGEADTNKNNIVTVSELFAFIDKGVKKYTQNKQRPSIAGNYDENMPVSTVRQ